ncbi:MAG: polyamine ABC transporter substrate-binding protein [Alphaproteobacteria bacterium]|nr:polyamine ABC transporter substrate-binding protein [Alphaproteobacteria bacterium]
MRNRSIIVAFVGALLAMGPTHAEQPELHVYNWSDYIAPHTIANFTSETGIAVTYDVYDGNEVLEAKLLAGQSGYDVVVPSASPFMAREIKAGAFRELDKAKLPNLKNLDPAMLALAAAADPGNAHGVPYLWSVTGIGYNEALAAQALGNDGPRDTLALLFDPDNAKRLAACGISLLDTPQEVIPAALAYLGIDPKSRDLGDLDKAVALLLKIRPHVRKFHSSQYINDLATGDLCLALGYSGDVIQARNRAREASNGVKIAFRVPKEGAQFSIDMLGIPKDAPHPDNALKFIDYILRPPVIAAISDAVSYPNPNAAATALVGPEIRDDPGIYPPEAVRKLFYIDLPAPRDYERARTRAWNRIKAGG